MSDVFRAKAHELLGESFGDYVARKGKRRWCDKSLGTSQVAGFLGDLLPSAQFICLFRRWRDVVASGLDACPWGLSGYGFDPFAGRFPANHMHALAAYWLDHTQAILAAESQVGADRCIRLRYEDLVADPTGSMNGVFEFLGEPELSETHIADAFRMEHDDGPGDHKIWYTTRVRPDSIGNGDRIPIELVPPLLVAELDGVERMLGYAPHPARDPADPEAGDAASAEVAPKTPAGGTHGANVASNEWLEDADSEAIALSQVLAELLAAGRFGAVVQEREEIATIRVVVAYGPPARGRALTFGHIEEGASPCKRWQVSATASVWRKVLSDVVNPGSLVRRGELRYHSADAAEGEQSVVRARLTLLLRAVSPYDRTPYEPEERPLSSEFEAAIL